MNSPHVIKLNENDEQVNKFDERRKKVIKRLITSEKYVMHYSQGKLRIFLLPSEVQLFFSLFSVYQIYSSFFPFNFFTYVKFIPGFYLSLGLAQVNRCLRPAGE